MHVPVDLHETCKILSASIKFELSMPYLDGKFYTTSILQYCLELSPRYLFLKSNFNPDDNTRWTFIS